MQKTKQKEKQQKKKNQMKLKTTTTKPMFKKCQKKKNKQCTYKIMECSSATLGLEPTLKYGW